jgi:diketogulonate reductase-like aldo/keto reductase
MSASIRFVPGDETQATLEAYRALEEYVDTGKLLALGVSNCYDPKTLDWLITEARIKVSVVQNRWYEGNGFDWGGESCLKQ